MSKSSHCLHFVFSFEPGVMESLCVPESTRSGAEALLCDHGQVKAPL